MYDRLSRRFRKNSVTFGLDYKDFEDQILLDVNTGLQSPISYLNWSLNYNGTLRGERSTSGGAVTVSRTCPAAHIQLQSTVACAAL